MLSILTCLVFIITTITAQIISPSVHVSLLTQPFTVNATTILALQLYDVDISTLIIDPVLTSFSTDPILQDLSVSLLAPRQYTRELLIQGWQTHNNTILCKDGFGVAWFGLEYLPIEQKFRSILTNQDYFLNMYNTKHGFNIKRAGKKDEAWTFHCPVMINILPKTPNQSLSTALYLPSTITPQLHLSIHSLDELNQPTIFPYVLPLPLHPLNALPLQQIPMRTELPFLQPNESILYITDISSTILPFPDFPPNTFQLTFTFYTNINGVFHLIFNQNHLPQQLYLEFYSHHLVQPWCHSESDDTFGQIFGYPLTSIDFFHVTQPLSSTKFNPNDPTTLTPTIYLNEFDSLTPRKITCSLSVRTLSTINMQQRRSSSLTLQYERSTLTQHLKPFSLDQSFRPIFFSSFSVSSRGLRLHIEFRITELPINNINITLPPGLNGETLQGLKDGQSTHCTHFSSTLSHPSNNTIFLSNIHFYQKYNPQQRYTNDDDIPLVTSCTFLFYPIPPPNFISSSHSTPLPPPLHINETSIRYDYHHAHQFQQAPIPISLSIDDVVFFNSETDKPTSSMKLLTYPSLQSPNLSYTTYELPRYRALSTIYEYQFTLHDLYGQYHMVSTFPVLSLHFSCQDELSTKKNAIQRHYCPYTPFKDAIPFRCMSTRPTSTHQSPVYFQTPHQYTPSPLASESYQQKPKFIQLSLDEDHDFDQNNQTQNDNDDGLNNIFETMSQNPQSCKKNNECTFELSGEGTSPDTHLPPTFTPDRELFPLHMDYDPMFQTWNADLFFLSNIIDYNIEVVCTRTVIEDWIFGFNPRVPLTLHLSTTELPERNLIAPDRFNTMLISEPAESVPRVSPRWHKIPKKLPLLSPTLRIKTGLQLMDPTIHLPFLNSTVIRHEIKRLEHILSSLFKTKFPLSTIADPQFNDQLILIHYQQEYFSNTQILSPIPLLTQHPHESKNNMPYYHDSVHYSTSNQPVDTTNFSIHPHSLPRISPFNQAYDSTTTTTVSNSSTSVISTTIHPSRIISGGPFHFSKSQDLYYIPSRFRENLLTTTYPWEYISLGTMETTLRQNSHDGNNVIQTQHLNEITSSLNTPFYTNIELQYLLQDPLSPKQVESLQQLLSYTLYTYFTNILDSEVAYGHFGQHDIHLRSKYDRLALVQPMLAFLNSTTTTTTSPSTKSFSTTSDIAPHFLISAQSIYRTLPESSSACGIYPNSAYFVTNSSQPITKATLPWHREHSMHFKLCTFNERCDFHHDCDQSQGLRCEKLRCQLAPRRRNIIEPKTSG